MMGKRRNNPTTACKLKKKMTKEQMQLAIIKKKECDAKALTIVEQLLEPVVDPAWLIENLKDINRCHMEDVIEERAIVKLCGYVLCQKPLTVVYNQRYHISLKDKKVYDVTKRKNFCSSSCFSASNYLLEQLLTSPLWLRDNEEIPKFRIFDKEKQSLKNFSIDTHGKEVDIANAKNTDQEDALYNIKSQDSTFNKDSQSKTKELQIEAVKEISKCTENFVLETVQNFELKDLDTTVNKSVPPKNYQNNNTKVTTKIKDVETSKEADGKTLQTNEGFHIHVEKYKKDRIMKNKIKLETGIISNIHVTEKDKNTCIDNIIQQSINPIKNKTNDLNNECSNILTKKQIESEDVIEQTSYPVKDRFNEISSNSDDQYDLTVAQGKEIDKLPRHCTSKTTKKRKQKACEKLTDINLAARVEESLHEWITDQTVDYLFKDESVKKKVINAIEIQENHRILCGKLDRLQVQEEREDAEILGRTALKPAPHFAVLKEEGQKLNLKVHAFYEGKTNFEEPPKFDEDEGTSGNTDTFLPLTDTHAPQILRRKIFLEKLDQVLPDLLKTLAGNNDMYARASLNYSSVRCAPVKALVSTFSLSAKNIIFKTAEWTLIGLVIIKMLSLSDPYLASLLSTKQANLYISMILTAYKLNSDYLNLLVTSFNPNINPR
ncbi:RNA polymerase II subunit B1 CTD phosphatase Rpap2 [Phymastichus coffea]|uniref:RNA polymerase II subunit B1 CTD phosphatase Rpap2 n=1 Tax=Phymastichus coffea TaxID=108790 RepID=UPI00273CC87F|nr:RNA polymerase II subunit B1 CTD phosphatase Rpap2 [Phymastichus coffea]